MTYLYGGGILRRGTDENILFYMKILLTTESMGLETVTFASIWIDTETSQLVMLYRTIAG